MARLCVNIDHVATVRQARRTIEPDPVAAAVLCELGGAAGITVHLREDRRHIQDRDLELLRQTVKAPLNLEMAASYEMRAIALRVRPQLVMIVPEGRQEVTTEGGLDAAGQEPRLTEFLIPLKEAGIPISLFIDPRPEQVEAAKRLGVGTVELHTGDYANACLVHDFEKAAREWERLRSMARFARVEKGLTVNAGHGLDYRNVERVAAIEGLADLHIGHSIVSRAIYVGLERAVREMAELIRGASPRTV
jgi:pyridoxine 5-phosphate synthase